VNRNASNSAPAKRSGGIGRSMLRAGGAIHRFMYRRGVARKMGQMQTVLLTTRGRKTGKPHTVPLGAVREGDAWVVIASNAGADLHPNWWLNMVANPDVTLQVNDQVIRARMQEITDSADRDRIWNTVVSTMKGYANYPKKTSRTIPLGLLRPVT
jgi:deazaflavin-dependent oxidoreductase (nitroreductase family)